MKTLPISLGVIAVFDEKLVIVCEVQTGGTLTVRNLATGAVFAALPGQLSERKTPISERLSDEHHNRLIHATDAQVAAAQAREQSVLNVLAQTGSLDHAVKTEARRIAIGARTLWRWIQRYREWPSVESLLPQGHGGFPNQRRLRLALESLINQAIDEVYLKQPQVTRRLWNACSNCVTQVL